ncbi:MAG: SLC13 family permease [Anaerolineales bacterium]|jgi:di/tricarboxylate transporter
MTPEISRTLVILVVTVLLFVTERIGVDLVALLVLSTLTLTNLVTPEEALAGFSNTAVVTVWAVFILSGGLARTGVTSWIGRQVLRLGGRGEIRLMLVIMFISAFLSAFMNNVGVTAMFLPVVLEISRRTKLSPSKLLIPLAFSSVLGGMTTLIGTPPNILMSQFLVDFGQEPFAFFDYAPVGLPVALGGILFLALSSRFLLPARAEVSGSPDRDMSEAFAVQERLFIVSLPADSHLAGKNLIESRLGSALGLNVIGIIREGQTKLAPSPHDLLHDQDRLLVIGKPQKLLELGRNLQLIIEDQQLAVKDLITDKIQITEIGLSPDSPLIGKTLEETSFRQKYGGLVLAIWRENHPIRTNFDEIALREDDLLLVQAPTDQMRELIASPEFGSHRTSIRDSYQLDERLMLIKLPEGSSLCGKTLIESRLGDSFGLGVLGIVREGVIDLMPDPAEVLMAGDTLLVKGKEEDVSVLRDFQELQIDEGAEPKIEAMESQEAGTFQVVLSPQTSLDGKTLRQIDFREKYGLTVLAVYRGRHTHRSNLRDMPLRFGDALMVFGARDKLKLLANDPDFLVLAESSHTPPRAKKALISVLLMLGVVLSVALGWIPIDVAAVTGAALMVLTGCLSMTEAYRSIDWKSVFLIAGMLPLGTAMQTSGTAQYLAEGVIALMEPYGVEILLITIFLLTVVASQFMPNPVVAVLMAPIALTTASHLGYSVHAFLMVIAIAASNSFLSPVAHTTTVIIMGPGRYKFRDYFWIGLPLAVVTLVITMLALPVFWPLVP